MSFANVDLRYIFFNIAFLTTSNFKFAKLCFLLLFNFVIVLDTNLNLHSCFSICASITVSSFHSS